MADNAAAIVGVEILAAAQGCDFHAPLTSSDDLERVRATVRRRVPRLDDDRYLHPDLLAATALVREGALIAGLETPLPSITGATSERDWLTIRRGSAPLVLSIPHAGIDIPAEIETRLASPWLGRKDTDWWVDRLYEFAATLDATIMRTAISRTVIDVNRDPSGAFALPRPGDDRALPDHDVRRRATLSRRRGAGCERDRETRGAVVRCPITRHYRLSWSGYAECTSGSCFTTAIRSARRFRACSKAFCPYFNIGTNAGVSCAPELTSGGGSRVRRDVVQPRDQRPLSGGLHHPPSWEPASGRPRDPDGARLPGLSARTDRACRRDKLASSF